MKKLVPLLFHFFPQNLKFMCQQHFSNATMFRANNTTEFKLEAFFAFTVNNENRQICKNPSKNIKYIRWFSYRPDLNFIIHFWWMLMWIFLYVYEAFAESRKYSSEGILGKIRQMPDNTGLTGGSHLGARR